MDRIKIIIGLFVAIVIITIFACEEDYDSISDENCSTYTYLDCNTLEPIEADLKLNFSVNRRHKSVPFEIYEGTIDKGKLIIQDTAHNTEVVYIMPIPNNYTVKAKYVNNGKTIYAIDGVKMKAKSTVKCDSICWQLREFRLNLMLQ